MPNHLLFQAYTRQQVAGCRYFLLKYLAVYNLKPPPQTAVVVYTGQPDAFEGFTNFFARFEMPEPGEAAPINTITKTGVLHRFFQQYGGNVLYCAPATYPLQPLEHLFSDIERGSLYLHAPRRYKESELQTALHKRTANNDKTATAVATPPARVTVWHTAVVGLNDLHKGLVEKLLHQDAATAPDMAADYAYTRQFGEAGKIKSAGKYIFDYSPLKEFSQLLEAFFKKNEEESIPNQVKGLHHIDAAAIQAEKETYLQQPLFKKWMHTILGKNWTIKKYESRL